MRSTSDDLTTRARIRDAAIAVFGDQGFGVGVRAIAAAAGVSPGLVIHHFGSKDGLRQACDDHVREGIRTAKVQYVQNPSPNGLLHALAEIEDFAPHMAYLMRSFQSGGPLMLSFYEHMIEDIEQYLAVGIAAGSLRAPRDLKATARYLATTNGGGMMLFLQLYAARHEGPMDFRKALREYADQMMLPALELYTHGMLTDSTALDTLTQQ
ncbi:TetR/AcrR family transcriptional regulator [Nocardia huaxiensis]|uniref:TetR/AcrR family transcriptional regulator n=1 Tax=Nocardia huaxiensis TaxID=2755382 RepID=A0A7D6VC20_9NOCA|nr:TetR family transcriptional regulator [Nocardia huaxiensis]QLY32801.1 TetR/AcrR family transcriptional regulator [Nocardia huaxiensis]UFS93460.1 TetR family transcriptional regulator [Nocardia huaxiensis]